MQEQSDYNSRPILKSPELLQWERRKRAIALYGLGHTPKQIREMLGVAKGTVHNYLHSRHNPLPPRPRTPTDLILSVLLSSTQKLSTGDIVKLTNLPLERVQPTVRKMWKTGLLLRSWQRSTITTRREHHGYYIPGFWVVCRWNTNRRFKGSSTELSRHLSEEDAILAKDALCQSQTYVDYVDNEQRLASPFSRNRTPVVYYGQRYPCLQVLMEEKQIDPDDQSNCTARIATLGWSVERSIDTPIQYPQPRQRKIQKQMQMQTQKANTTPPDQPLIMKPEEMARWLKEIDEQRKPEKSIRRPKQTRTPRKKSEPLVILQQTTIKVPVVAMISAKRPHFVLRVPVVRVGQQATKSA